MRVHDDAELVRGPLYDYLGHFRNPKYLKQGHNDSGTLSAATVSGNPNAINDTSPLTTAYMEEAGGLD